MKQNTVGYLSVMKRVFIYPLTHRHYFEMPIVTTNVTIIEHGYHVASGDTTMTVVLCCVALAMLSIAIYVIVRARVAHSESDLIGTNLRARMPGTIALQCIASSVWLCSIIISNDHVPVRVLFPPSASDYEKGDVGDLTNLCGLFHLLFPWTIGQTMWVLAVLLRLAKVHHLDPDVHESPIAPLVFASPVVMVIVSMLIFVGDGVTANWAAYIDPNDVHYGDPVCTMTPWARNLLLACNVVQLLFIMWAVYVATRQTRYSFVQRPRLMLIASVVIFALLLMTTGAIYFWVGDGATANDRHAYSRLCILISVNVILTTSTMLLSQIGDVLLHAFCSVACRGDGIAKRATAYTLVEAGKRRRRALPILASLRDAVQQTMSVNAAHGEIGFAECMVDPAIRHVFYDYVQDVAPAIASLWTFLGGWNHAARASWISSAPEGLTGVAYTEATASIRSRIRFIWAAYLDPSRTTPTRVPWQVKDELPSSPWANNRMCARDLRVGRSMSVDAMAAKRWRQRSLRIGVGESKSNVFVAAYIPAVLDGLARQYNIDGYNTSLMRDRDDDDVEFSSSSLLSSAGKPKYAKISSSDDKFLDDDSDTDYTTEEKEKHVTVPSSEEEKRSDGTTGILADALVASTPGVVLRVRRVDGEVALGGTDQSIVTEAFEVDYLEFTSRLPTDAAGATSTGCNVPLAFTPWTSEIASSVLACLHATFATSVVPRVERVATTQRMCTPQAMTNAVTAIRAYVETILSTFLFPPFLHAHAPAFQLHVARVSEVEEGLVEEGVTAPTVLHVETGTCRV